ncbi:hypothetical protein C7U74_28485 [Escherichia coli]|nr:hypothetical protein C7U74_28485 [Escherichia coli]
MTVTVCPASTPDVLPESVNAAEKGAALIASSLVMLLYTSDAADDSHCLKFGGVRCFKKKNDNS